MAVLGGISIVQGIIDVVIPALTGGEPFAWLFKWTEALGPGFLTAYLLVHNLGLACIVPGFGFLASYFEKHTSNRQRIGLILLGAVLVSLFVALEYLIQAADRFDLAFALALFTLEALAVLLLAFPSALHMRGFVPTPAYGWALVTPFRRLLPAMAASFLLLVAASLVETLHILR